VGSHEEGSGAGSGAVQRIRGVLSELPGGGFCSCTRAVLIFFPAFVRDRTPTHTHTHTHTHIHTHAHTHTHTHTHTHNAHTHTYGQPPPPDRCSAALRTPPHDSHSPLGFANPSLSGNAGAFKNSASCPALRRQASGITCASMQEGGAEGEGKESALQKLAGVDAGKAPAPKKPAQDKPDGFVEETIAWFKSVCVCVCVCVCFCIANSVHFNNVCISMYAPIHMHTYYDLNNIHI
jgi:hypothetical protein